MTTVMIKAKGTKWLLSDEEGRSGGRPVLLDRSGFAYEPWEIALEGNDGFTFARQVVETGLTSSDREEPDIREIVGRFLGH